MIAIKPIDQNDINLKYQNMKDIIISLMNQYSITKTEMPSEQFYETGTDAGTILDENEIVQMPLGTYIKQGLGENIFHMTWVHELLHILRWKVEGIRVKSGGKLNTCRNPTPTLSWPLWEKN